MELSFSVAKHNYASNNNNTHSLLLYLCFDDDDDAYVTTNFEQVRSWFETFFLSSSFPTMVPLLGRAASKFRYRCSASLGLIGLVLFCVTCGVNSNNNNPYPTGNNNGGSQSNGAYWQGIDQNSGAAYPTQNGIIETSQSSYSNLPNSNSVSGSLGDHTIESGDDNIIADPSQHLQYQQQQQQQQSSHHHASSSSQYQHQHQPTITDEYGNLLPSTTTMIAGVNDRDIPAMSSTGMGIGATMPANTGFSSSSHSIPPPSQPSPPSPQPQAFFGGSDLSQVDKEASLGRVMSGGIYNLYHNPDTLCIHG